MCQRAKKKGATSGSEQPPQRDQDRGPASGVKAKARPGGKTGQPGEAWAVEGQSEAEATPCDLSVTKISVVAAWRSPRKNRTLGGCGGPRVPAGASGLAGERDGG